MKRLQLINAIRKSLQCSSIQLQKTNRPCMLGSGSNTSLAPGPTDWCSNLQTLVGKDSVNVEVMLEKSNFRICAIEPKLIVPLNGWTSYLLNQSPFDGEKSKDVVFIMLELMQCNHEVLEFCDQRNQVTKLEELIKLVAWKSGRSFQVVAECTENGFCQLTRSFLDNCLVTQELLEITSVTSIDVRGQPDKMIPGASGPQTPLSHFQKLSGIHLSSNFNNSSQLLDQDCKEELSGTYSDSDCAGEAPAEPLEEIAPEMLTPVTRKENLHGKPPNVLVYCGKKDSSRLFENVRSIFAQCLNTDKYTVYHLKHDQVKTTPWLDNTTMLIISSDKVYDGVDEVFLKYFLEGGTVVSFGSLFDAKFVTRIQTNSKSSILTLSYENWSDATFICGRHVYETSLKSLLCDVTLTCLAQDKRIGNPVILEAVHETSGGVALLSQVNFDKDPSEMAISQDIFTILKLSNSIRFEILRSLFRRLGIDSDQPVLPSLTPIVLLSCSSKSKQQFLKSLSSRLNDGHLVSKDVTLQFITDDCSLSAINVTNSVIPIITDAQRISILFDFAVYKANLKTKLIGNVMFYADVIATTMNLIESLMFSLPTDIGLVAVATRQTAGVGRGGNAWLSPPGCAMFSLHLRVPQRSLLGERIPFLQHIVSLAVVLGVRQKPGYENLDLCIKWPNDIYYGASMKLGGNIVKSSIMNDIIHANIGCGVNVGNKDPTICINDLIQMANETSRGDSKSLNLLSTEEVIALSLNCLEDLIAKFQSDGPDDFKRLYYRYWLHGNQRVRLNSEDGPEATVVGLDEFGFLLVRLSNGQMESVQPDGNSFDMMRNLIAPKSN